MIKAKTLSPVKDKSEDFESYESIKAEEFESHER